MQNDSALPPFNCHGHLPEGVHDTSIEHLKQRFVTNVNRTLLWDRLQNFLLWATSTGNFSQAYIDGGFITDKAAPEDVDMILQTKAAYGTEAFLAMEPFIAMGIVTIYETYSVHLHFWCEGFPGGMSDFRRFFQYLRPQDAAPLG
jgi:hypothetical protein